MEKYNEEDFYSNEGWPPEEYLYCRYSLDIIDEEQTDETDYDQFALVNNAAYPYIRLTKKRGNRHFPCGMATSPATDGIFASMTEKERNVLCPKIAWGLSAIILYHLRYDSVQKDYVLLKPIKKLFAEYYNAYKDSYIQSHNGLKYTKITDDEKELHFIDEHSALAKQHWKKSSPLMKYPVLYNFAAGAEKDYEDFLQNNKNEIQKK
jgi:hypothetical protein